MFRVMAEVVYVVTAVALTVFLVRHAGDFLRLLNDPPVRRSSRSFGGIKDWFLLALVVALVLFGFWLIARGNIDALHLLIVLLVLISLPRLRRMLQ